MDLRTKTRQAGSVTIVDVSGQIVLREESAALPEAFDRRTGKVRSLPKACPVGLRIRTVRRWS